MKDESERVAYILRLDRSMEKDRGANPTPGSSRKRHLHESAMNHFSLHQTPESFCSDTTAERRIIDRVRSFVAVHFLFQDDVDLASDTSMLDAGILDSLGVMELVAFLEDEFSITVEERELIRENLDTLDGVAGLVQRHLDGA